MRITSNRAPTRTSLLFMFIMVPLRVLADNMSMTNSQWVVIPTNSIIRPSPTSQVVTAGIVVDRTSGYAYLMTKSFGLCRSTNHGCAFAPLDSGKEITGFIESASAMNMNPGGRELLCTFIHGSQIITRDGGTTWEKIKTRCDLVAVDWEASGRCMLGKKHGGTGVLTYSGDGGQTWVEIRHEPTWVGHGIFDTNTLVLGTRQGIELSVDTGKTWSKVSELVPSGHMMKVFKGTGYWVSRNGLLATRDKGRTWSIQGSPVDSAWGPCFGDTENHIVVLGPEGIAETTDGAATWTLVATVPASLRNSVAKLAIHLITFDWDPAANVFYFSRRNQEAYMLKR